VCPLACLELGRKRDNSRRGGGKKYRGTGIDKSHALSGKESVIEGYEEREVNPMEVCMPIAWTSKGGGNRKKGRISPKEGGGSLQVERDRKTFTVFNPAGSSFKSEDVEPKQGKEEGGQVKKEGNREKITLTGGNLQTNSDIRTSRGAHKAMEELEESKKKKTHR